MTRARSYLRLPLLYAAHLGGLRWSTSDNVLERADGTTFAFAPQIAEFLEGFASRRPALHFPFLVHLMVLLLDEPDPIAEGQHIRLWESFHATGKNFRHAGAFFAELCLSLPDALSKEELTDVCQRLRGPAQIVHWSVADATPAHSEHGPVETPPLEPDQFLAFIVRKLERLTDEELETWLEHGRGPVREAAAAVSRAMPVSLADRLDSLRDRPRLAAAQVYLKQLTGALTLPPRRLSHRDLPLGGYSDVTTRGNVDQILPSQFALDDWDFLRRYAERELLYFRREEPHSQTREDLLVLLDQGVRTWGDVRVVLGAALLAFGRHAVLKKTPFLVATTASAEAVDPVQMDLEALGNLVEASDLTSHPALALERILEQPGPPSRDIVLLTHPRSLQEADVQTAARRARPGTRLFALTLDRLGNAALSEMRSGVAIPVREFHVDLAPLPEVDEPVSSTTPRNESGWTGDVEPIPFPFQFGSNGVVHSQAFDFDPTGQLLLMAGPHGMLYLWHANGTLAEILPRGMADGEIVTQLSLVLCVTDGFLVVGARAHNRPVLLHYHLNQRKCTAHLIQSALSSEAEYEYSAAHHCVIVQSRMNPNLCCAIDLGTGEKFTSNMGGVRNRAFQAAQDWLAKEIETRRLRIYSGGETSTTTTTSLWFDRNSSSLTLFQAHSLWVRFVPLSDGKPRYRECELIDGQLRNSVLALQSRKLQRLDTALLCLYRLQTNALLGEYAMSMQHPGFVLSPDGNLLARQVSKSIIEISHVAGSIAPLGRTRVGGFAQRLTLYLDDYQLTLAPGEHYLQVDWQEGYLECERHVTQVQGEVGTSEGIPDFLRRDRIRWHAGAARRVVAVCDRYGQVALFDRKGKLLCMFFAFRNHLAGWMPDGTRFGQASGPPKPEVLRKFGKVLWLASVRG